jgi:hypothetical protein
MIWPRSSPVRQRCRASGSRAAWVACSLALASGCLQGEVDRYASVVDRYLETPFVGSTAAGDRAPYLEPERALGPPDGRTVALGVGAHVILRFFREIPNGPGPDLRVYEVGPDGSVARIAVSADGSIFFELDEVATGPTTELDLDDVTVEADIAFVRIRGVDDRGEELGFDLDAVEALH